jgi:hypothetical protein
MSVAKAGTVTTLPSHNKEFVNKLKTDDGKKESQLFKDLDQMQNGKHDHIISKGDLEKASKRDDDTGKYAYELLHNPELLKALVKGDDKFSFDQDVQKFDSKA